MPLRVTQETLEAVVSPAATKVRVSQEVLEAVLVPPAAAKVRVTQEVVEVVLGAPPAEPDVWTVRASPRVYWDAGEEPEGPDAWTVRAAPRVYWDGVAEDVLHPRGEFRVDCHPKIAWDETVTDTANRWFVNCKPKVAYVTGPGTASTKCISGSGVVPPPAEEPPESLELNYVF